MQIQDATANANADIARNAAKMPPYEVVLTLSRLPAGQEQTPHSAPIILFGKNAQTVPTVASIEQTTIKK
jgi:hypothetical protein